MPHLSQPADFIGTLRPYQEIGLSWLSFLDRFGLGACLADDMGLGKTATTLAHLAQRPGPHLVVCPLSVVHNWEAESTRFTPGQQVVVHHGAGRQQAGPALFSASFIMHAWGNEITSGTLYPYNSANWDAVPLGHDCQSAYPYTPNGASACR